MKQPLTASRERAALWLSSVVITVVVLLQDNGRIVPETKLDVVLDPWTMASRSLSAWDPSAGFGRVQNQAIGYLFPMGMWNMIGDAVSSPPWLTQRLWLAGIVVISMWGAHRVATAAGISTAGGRISSALVYALAPATISVTFFQSAGQLPYALIPHVLAELMAARQGDSQRRVAARSTLWLVAMGGVNAASVAAVVPLVGVWFWSREQGSDRRRLAGWWILGAVLGSLWWAIPLVVTVRYGIRFTDFTETASTTTITESATEILRGTGHWLPYLDTSAGTWLPGGWAMIASPLAIVATTAIAAVGLAGLARSDSPQRRWTTTSLLLGATVMGIGWASTGGGPFAGVVHDLLDGPFAPLRNVQKFAAVVRLPLAIGFGHMVAVATSTIRSDIRIAHRGSRGLPKGLPLGWSAPALGVLLVIGAVAPAVETGLMARGSFTDVPGAWRQAAQWLDDQHDSGRTLLLPGSAFGEYRWGRPLDEPISSLTDSPWVVRDLVPLGGNGSTRLLNGIEDALATDSLPEGFVATLQRAGISHVLARNDLDLARTGGPNPATMRRLLQGVDGLEHSVSFGPVMAEWGDDGRGLPTSVHGEIAPKDPIHQIDIYTVPNPTPPVTTYSLDQAIVMGGGPEALLAMPAGLMANSAVVLANDAPASLTNPIMLSSDSARLRDVNFNALRDNKTETLEVGQLSPATGSEPVDRWASDTPIDLSVAELQGVKSIRASGAVSDPHRPESQPFAAFDSNPDTYWSPDSLNSGQWIEVGLSKPTKVRSLTLQSPAGTGARALSVLVSAGSNKLNAKLSSKGPTTIELDGSAVAAVRIEITEVSSAPDTGSFGFSEISIDGVDMSRPIIAAPASIPSREATPSTKTEAGTDAVVLLRDRRDRLDLTRRDEDGRFDRLFKWGGSDATIRGTAGIGDGDQAMELLSRYSPSGTSLSATATSRYRDHLAADAMWVLDNDPSTSWVSDTSLDNQTLTISWHQEAAIDSFTLVGTASGQQVTVNAGGTTQQAITDGSGRIVLPKPVLTNRLHLEFVSPGGDLPITVAEVQIPALSGQRSAAPSRSTAIDLDCGEGPSLRIDGQQIETRARTTVGDLVAGVPVTWQACAPVSIAEGEHRVEAERGALFASSIVISNSSLPAGTVQTDRRVRATTWGASSRTVHMEAGNPAILATTENFNAGWQATLQGRTLVPVRVDGWRQGWVVPSSASGTVSLSYKPATTQRAGFLVGLAGVALLMAGAILGPRRIAETHPRTQQSPSPEPLEEQMLPSRSSDPTKSLGTGLLAVVVTGVSLGGAAVVLAAPMLLVHRFRERLPLVAAILAMAAGIVALGTPGAAPGSEVGTFSPVAQWLATASILAVGVGSIRSNHDHDGHQRSQNDTKPEETGSVDHQG